MTLIDKIVHYIFLLLIWTVFKLVYSNCKVEKNVTLFCLISILVLLTHMLISWFLYTYLAFKAILKINLNKTIKIIMMFNVHFLCYTQTIKCQMQIYVKVVKTIFFLHNTAGRTTKITRVQSLRCKFL